MHHEMNTILCFWTGNTSMTKKREMALLQLVKHAGTAVYLVGPDDIDVFLVKGHPFHPAYPYLSETHKADYLRTYVMHFHGGGYSDIKAPTASWKHAFGKLAKSKAYISGYRESGPDCTANPELKVHWKKLLGNGAYIVRPQTPFTQEWFDQMNRLLDSKLEALKRSPAQHARDSSEEGNGYPLGWSELLGQIFHKICYKYHKSIRFDVPIPDCTNYR